MGDQDARAIREAAGLLPDRSPRWMQWLLDPWSNERTIAALRLLMASIALVVTSSLPREPDMAPQIYAALGLFLVYSAAGYIALRYELARRIPAAHWIDVAWYTAFTAMGGGTTSPFFSFYYFAILIASFRGGWRSGMQVTVASALLFTAVGYMVHTADDTVNRFILRPVYLLIIGAMMARLGNMELLLKRRLVLLKEVSTLANPRFGEGQTVGSLLYRLRTFHDADFVLLVIADAAGRTFSMRRADRGSPDSGVVERPLDAARGRLLTGLPWTQAIVHRPDRARTMNLDEVADRSAQASASAPALPLLGTLTKMGAGRECRSFMSVPVRYGAAVMARLYVGSNRPGAFDESDVAFLTMALDQVMPAIERVRLLNRLALDGAAQERQRLSRDLHDSVIQPYIGLQIGIAAALQQAQDRQDPAPMLERLLDVCDREVANLRHYGSRLKARRDGTGGLVGGVRRLAASFADTADMRVEVTAPPDLFVEDRLAEEVLQLVAEGISNIRRHTVGAAANISLERCGDYLKIRIENDGTPGEAFHPFVPASITGRAHALGGSVNILERAGGGASVQVSIPV